MNESLLEECLSNAESVVSRKAISSRISRGHRIEEYLGKSLDLIVSDDDATFDALRALRASGFEHNGNYQNALRWYYRAVKGKGLPSAEPVQALIVISWFCFV